MRHFNSRLTPKTLAFSKELEMHRYVAMWEDMYYNFIRAHKSLRVEVINHPKCRWQKRTRPEGRGDLTDHIWTVKELLTSLSPPGGNT